VKITDESYAAICMTMQSQTHVLCTAGHVSLSLYAKIAIAGVDSIGHV